MSTTKELENWENSWETTVGAWFPGERVILRGKNIFTELRDLPLIGYLVFGITGRTPSKEAITFYEALYSLGASFPDPRLWNNRVATLAATARSTSNLGISAGVAVSEATIYGARPIYAIAIMLQEIQEKLNEGESLKEILKERIKMKNKGNPAKGKNRAPSRVPGYGRPITQIDERLPPLFKLMDELKINGTPFITLILKIERTLKEELNHDLSINIATLAAAFAADQGLTTRQIYQFYCLAFSPGIAICNVDAEAHKEGSFFPMRCQSITYKGKLPRQWKD